MKRASAGREQLTAAAEVYEVIGLAPVERAAPPLDHPLGLQLSKVIGNERLRLLKQLAELSHTAVAPREFDQQPPAQRMRGQLKKAGAGASPSWPL